MNAPETTFAPAVDHGGILGACAAPFIDLAHAVDSQLRVFTSVQGLQDFAGDFVLMFPAAMCVIWLLFAFLYVFRREWRLPYSAEFAPSVAVVVAAHNEELVIRRTIEALLASDYPNFDVHIVSDGSTDRTVAIAERYAGANLHVHELRSNVGKSCALQHALDRIDADLFMVIDADTVVDPAAVRFMVQQFVDERIAGVTGNPRVANVNGLLTAMQAMEYASIIGLIKRADSFWGGLFTVSGAAACFRTSTLKAAGGWSSRSATEDIELSWRLQKLGHRLAYEPRAVVHVQSPTKPVALFRQRARWAQGATEVVRMHGSLWRSANVALIPLAAQAIATVIWMALVIMSVGGGLVGLMTDGAVETAPSAFWSEATRIFIITLGLFTCQSLAACTFDSNYVQRSLRLVPLAGLYPLYYWLIIVPSFLTGLARGWRSREAGVWKRTERSAPVEKASALKANMVPASIG